MIHCPWLQRAAFIPFFIALLLFLSPNATAQEEKKADPKTQQGPPPSPVQVAPVEERMVSDQVALIGTTEAIRTSTVAAEVAGIVEEFPVKAGDFVEKGDLLARLRDTELRLRLNGAVAAKNQVKAELENAEMELKRYSELKKSESVSQSQYDKARFTHRALTSGYQQREAEIERLQYELRQKKVFAPFAGFVSAEHIQVGEWLPAGGPVVTLLDLSTVLVTVDVPERYAVKIDAESPPGVRVPSLFTEPRESSVYAILPEGNSAARTIPVQVRLGNGEKRIRTGMEAVVTFPLKGKRQALLVPKDAIITAGANRLVYVVAEGKALPVTVEVSGYYGSSVAVAGSLRPGVPVVIRGNERLRPGQPVMVQGE